MGVVDKFMSAFGYERRAHPSNPPGWLVELFGGSKSHAGQFVSPDTAETLSAVYQAVKVRTKTLSSLPCHTYRRKGDNGRERENTHRIAWIVRNQPNNWQTPVEFFEMLYGHYLLRGNGIAEIITNEGGEVLQLIPRHPDKIRPKTLNGSYVMTRRGLVYEHQTGAGVRELFGDQVLHIRGPGDGVWGRSVITLASESLGLSMALEEHGARMFANAAKPAGLLKIKSHPGQPAPKIGPEAKKNILAAFKSENGGVENTGNTILLEQDMEWQQLGLSMHDAEFLASRQHQVDEVARWFDLPVHKLRKMDRATWNNIEHEGISFMTEDMRPDLVRFEQSMWRDLLGTREQETLFFEFKVEAMMRGDLKSRYEAYAIGKQWGWLSTNAIREKENENPVDGGDDLWMPVNMVPADMAREIAKPEPDDPPDDDPEGKSDARALLITDRLQRTCLPSIGDAVARWMKREVSAAKRAAKDPEGFMDWIETFYRDQPAHIVSVLLPHATAYGETLLEERCRLAGSAAPAPGLVQVWLREQVTAFANEEVERSRGFLEGVPSNNVAGTVDVLTAVWESERFPALPRALMSRLDEAMSSHLQAPKPVLRAA